MSVKCKCGRQTNNTYGGKHWCCVQCARNNGHTAFCKKRQS